MTVETPAEEFRPGSLFAERFRIVRELGRGGMGRVFLARDIKLERDIALKFVGEAVEKDEKGRERLLREARAAAALDHPFICKIYDAGEMGGHVFIAMEYVEGQTLREKTGGEPLPLRNVLQVINEIAEALEKAHAKGIVHRDLKPENIMLTPQGHVKVMDFGIAKIALADQTAVSRTLTKESLTEGGKIVGTIAYMSPEQACGDAVDTRSDIFSLGVVFYELLTGRPPFLRPTTAATLGAILKDPPPPSRVLPKRFSAQVNQILQKSLAKDPGRRFGDISELLTQTQSLQRDMAAIARPLFRKLSVVLPLAASLIVVVMNVLWFAWLKNRLFIKRVPVPVSVLVADFQNHTGDPAFEGITEEALCIGLEGAPFLNIYKRNNARKLMKELDAERSGKLDGDDAQLIARRELIKVVIRGAIEANGPKYGMNVQAIDPANLKTLSECSTTFRNKGELLGAIDKLAYRIRSDLGDIPKDPSQRHLIETFTTKSLEAMKAYVRAQELQEELKDHEAIAAYQAAIDQDPGFGRAYSGLAVSYYYTGQYEKYRDSMQRALARLDKMTDREKYRTRGVDFLLTRNYKKAIEEFLMLTQEFPADDIGHANLALAYWGVRDYKHALEQAQVSVELRPQSAIALRNLAEYAVDVGNYGLAETSAQKALKINPQYNEAYMYLARAQTGLGRFEEAEQTLQQYARLSEAGADRGLLSLALYESRLNDAMKILEKEVRAYLLAKGPSSAWACAAARARLAEVLMLKGQESRAVDELDRATPDLSEGVLYDAAQVYLKGRRIGKAAAIAKRLLGSPDPFLRALAKLTEAEIKILTGKGQDATADLEESINLLEEAKSSDDRWECRFYLGYAYLKKGAYAEGHSEFEMCLKRSGEMFDLAGDLGKVAWAHHYLGQVQEGLGSPAAAESYRRYLDIKRRSDGDPVVEEARRRLLMLDKKRGPEKK